jgi:hypothetical protein
VEQGCGHASPPETTSHSGLQTQLTTPSPLALNERQHSSGPTVAQQTHLLRRPLYNTPGTPQNPRTKHTLACLSLATWAANTIPPNANRTLRSALNHLIRWKRRLFLDDYTYKGGKLNTDQTMGFIWYLGNHITKAGGLWISPTSVNRYWNILKKYASHIAWGTPPSTTVYNNIIRTLKNHYKIKPRNRFPLTAAHLAAIANIGPTRIAATLPPRQARLFKNLWPATLAITSIGIFGLARKRELLQINTEPQHNIPHLLQLSDFVICQPNLPSAATNWTINRWLQVNLRWSKTEKLNATPLVAGAQLGTYKTVCPIELWQQWIEIRHHWTHTGNTTPFILPNGAPYTRDIYNRMIGACLPFFKIDEKLYGGGGFSLRKGGGQSLANNNLPDALLQRLGRWNSIAVKRYRTFSPLQRVQLSRWFDQPYDKNTCVFNASIKKWDPSTEQIAFENVPITPTRTTPSNIRRSLQQQSPPLSQSSLYHQGNRQQPRQTTTSRPRAPSNAPRTHNERPIIPPDNKAQNNTPTATPVQQRPQTHLRLYRTPTAGVSTTRRLAPCPTNLRPPDRATGPHLPGSAQEHQYPLPNQQTIHPPRVRREIMARPIQNPNHSRHPPMDGRPNDPAIEPPHHRRNARAVAIHIYHTPTTNHQPHIQPGQALRGIIHPAPTPNLSRQIRPTEHLYRSRHQTNRQDKSLWNPVRDRTQNHQMANRGNQPTPTRPPPSSPSSRRLDARRRHREPEPTIPTPQTTSIDPQPQPPKPSTQPRDFQTLNQ